jgi:hypothetical protein
MPSPFDLNGAWSADDGGIYYIRQQGDLVTWAGLHDSGFHMGIEFANVFQGRIGPDGATLRGEWVDVPRGGTNSSGVLALEIVEVALPPPPPPHLPPGEPSPPDPPGTMLELRQIPGQTTGGFGGTVWARNASTLEPQDIVDLAGRVQRYDKPLGENNPPKRDFSVMWGKAGKVTGPKLPPSPFDYGSFVCDDWDGDGDFTFHLAQLDWAHIQPDFWTSGWIEDNTDILSHFDGSNADGYALIFHCEAPMYGRQNDCDHRDDLPVILLPGWQEEGGNSILVNGQPIGGHLNTVTDHTLPPPDNQALLFNLGRYDQSILLRRDRSRLRVTGVIASDPDHWDDDGQPPEIHPVYAIDIIQDFTLPRAQYANLTGVWHASDIGTYYIRQIGHVLWWLGMSHDQGRSFANVFRGTIEDYSIEGNWVDVPMGAGGVLGGGSLVLYGGSLSTTLVKNVETAGYGATVWTKLYDTQATLPTRPELPVPPVGPIEPPSNTPLADEG